MAKRGRPAGDLVSLTVRVPRGDVERIDASGEGRSDFVRRALRMRLDGATSRKRRVPRRSVDEMEDRRERGEAAAAAWLSSEEAASDREVLLKLVRGHPGISERDAARELGWMGGRVSRVARELSDGGKIWYPSGGCMEAI